MSLVFPLALSDFFEDLTVTRDRFQLSEAMDYSETGAGEILPSRLGHRLWMGSVTIPIANVRAQERVLSKLDVLRTPGASFLLSDPHSHLPQADPTGSITAGVAATVGAINASDRDLTISGGPEAFFLSPGDHLSIAIGGGGTRYTYFRVVTGGAFSGGDATVEVQPSLPASVQAGDVVHINRPFLKGIYRPNTFNGGDRKPGRLAEAISFGWIQTLR